MSKINHCTFAVTLSQLISKKCKFCCYFIFDFSVSIFQYTILCLTTLKSHNIWNMLNTPVTKVHKNRNWPAAVASRTDITHTGTTAKMHDFIKGYVCYIKNEVDVSLRWALWPTLPYLVEFAQNIYTALINGNISFSRYIGVLAIRLQRNNKL